MGDNSSIQWTNATWNPVTGCSKVSPGCAHCYAETVANRFWAAQYPPVEINHHDGDCAERPRRFTDVQWHEDRFGQPLRWTKPRRVFVNSMSDLFHEAVPDAVIDQIFAVMAAAGQHSFQILTKRHARMREYVAGLGREYDRLERAARAGGFTLRFQGIPLVRWPIPNVWLGVSVENQHWADERVPTLLETPAAVRFVSYEPALAAVDFSEWLLPFEPETPRVHWIIVGGESGREARPFNLAWARAVLTDCRESGVACFVKQLGASPYEGSSPYASGAEAALCRPYELDLDKGHGGDWTEWPTDLRVREWPQLEGLNPAPASLAAHG